MAANPGMIAALQGILTLALKDKNALYKAYMPFIRGGGIFVPTPKSYSIGDDVFLLLALLDEAERIPIAGKVVWITPHGAQGGRAAGIGVQFGNSQECDAARVKIEAALADMQKADKQTDTM